MATGLSISALTRQSKPLTDIVGIEVGSGNPDGVPAVRLRKRNGRFELLAAGFLPLPGTLPLDLETAQNSTPVWLLPRPFQAPYAALALSSPLGFLRHAAETGEETPDKHATPFRTASRASTPESPALLTGLPEFQAAWAARLLPEGRRPTARSIQFSPAAALNALTTSPGFKTVSGTAIALFVFAEFTSITAFQEGQLMLYREHAAGYLHLRKVVSQHMGIDMALADSLLDDTLVDPTPIIEPVLRPLFRQVEISSDFLLRRRNCKADHFFLCGVPAGGRYWSSVFAQMMSHTLTPLPPLDGAEALPRSNFGAESLSPIRKQLLMTAYGAARAALEDA
ncbi:MAG TPA: hypothetical protein PLZ74_05735 [Kiritimatiellia bacterium]|nr:hypothetical protein [Kiritimatiellia bacterium]